MKPRGGGHRYTATSPVPSAVTPSSELESRARVISIDVPPQPVVARGNSLGRFDSQGPRRAESYNEIRTGHYTQDRLKQSAKRGISSPEKREADKRAKPRRSLSFNAAKSVADRDSSDHNAFEKSSNYSSSQTMNYPLRETMSLNQLPSGVSSYGYSSYSSASHRLAHSSERGLEDGYQGNHQGRPEIAMRSSSMMTLPSSESHSKHKHEKKSRRTLSTSSHERKLKAVSL